MLLCMQIYKSLTASLVCRVVKGTAFTLLEAENLKSLLHRFIHSAMSFHFT